MERNYYNEGFESFLKDKTDEYKMYPSDKVWNNIQSKLHPRRKWPFLAAALLMLGIGVGTKFVIDDWNQPGISSLENKAFPKDIYEDLNSPLYGQINNIEENNLSGTKPPRQSMASLNPLAQSIPSTENRFRLYPVISPELTSLETKSTPSPDLATVNVENDLSLDSKLFQAPQAKVISLSSREPKQKEKQPNLENPIAAKLNEIITTITNVKKKTSWQLYMSPTVSYRKLVGEASKPNSNNSGITYSANLGSRTDVNEAVTHKPSVGIELGTSFLYPISRNFRIKAGLQLNLNNYQVEAYNYIPEIAPYSTNQPGVFSRPINTVSYYRNFNGFSRTWLRNSHFMISVPLGLELTVAGNKHMSFNVASTIQPAYVINNQSYLVSTNLKNYAQEPSLYRKWNVHTGAEAFLAINTGSVKWVVGPQFRYQLLSSYKDKYPIKEHLLDFGFKVGVTKIIK